MQHHFKSVLITPAENGFVISAETDNGPRVFIADWSNPAVGIVDEIICGTIDDETDDDNS